MKHLYTLIIFTVLSFSLNAQWTNPALYYKFDEGAGTSIVDSSGNGNNSNTDCENCWSGEGKFEGAFHFGGNQTIDLPAKQVELNNANGSVAYWFLLPESGASSIHTFWWAGETGGDTFGPQNEMHINSEATETDIWKGGEIAFYIHDSLADNKYFLFTDPAKGSNPATPPSDNALVLSDGNWHHLTCTWQTGGNVALYVDGTAVWDTTAYNPNPWDCNIMTIGAANRRENRRLEGYMDEFRLYTEALSADDIASLYQFVPGDQKTDIETTMQPSIAVIQIFPNPAARNITLSAPANTDKIEIFGVTGKKQLITAVNGIAEINIEQLPSGIYYVKAFSDNSFTAAGKFLKQ